MSFWAIDEDGVDKRSMQNTLDIQTHDVTSLNVPIGRGVAFGVVLGVALWMVVVELIRSF